MGNHDIGMPVSVFKYNLEPMFINGQVGVGRMRASSAQYLKTWAALLSLLCFFWYINVLKIYFLIRVSLDRSCLDGLVG